MSKLQNLVNKLIDVVINYRQNQEPNLSEADTKHLATMAFSELIPSLRQLVNNMTYVRRQPLMHFFIYAIEQTKPLVDKLEPLSKSDTKIIYKILVDLLTINRDLLDRYQSPPHLLVTYGDVTAEMRGFKRSMLQGYTCCNSGQIITNTLFLSKDIYELTQTSDFNTIVAQLINEHQKPLLAEKKILRLEKTNSHLEAEHGESTERYQQVLLKLEQDLASYQLNQSSLEARNLELQEKNCKLQSLLLARDQTIEQLQQQTHELEKQIATNTNISTNITTKSQDIALSSSVVHSKPTPSSTISLSNIYRATSSMLFNSIRPVEMTTINRINSDKTTKQSF